MTRAHLTIVFLALLAACGTDHPFERGEVVSGPVAPEPLPSVSFQESVVPALQGCASCHAGGAGGWTYDGGPQAYEQAVSRIDLDAPAQSSLLGKATNEFAHGGGPQFTVESEEYEVVLAWIEAGGPDN